MAKLFCLIAGFLHKSNNSSSENTLFQAWVKFNTLSILMAFALS